MIKINLLPKEKVMKKCTKCGIEKELHEFYKNKSTKDGFQSHCKNCIKEYHQTEKYKEYHKEYQKEYNKIEKYKEYHKEYQKEYQKEYIKTEKYKTHQKEYIKTEKYKRDRRKREKTKRDLDPIYKLRRDISSKINIVLKSQNVSKYGQSILKYLPENYIQDLKQNLESQFEPWMNWNNHGKYDPNKKTWHIDHIYPQSLLPYDSMDHPNFLKCWDLSNLRPLEASANIRKSNSIPNIIPEIILKDLNNDNSDNNDK